MSGTDPNVTQMLRAVANGDRGQLDALMRVIYEDLRRIAASHMRQERSDHTLQPTALAHEAYVRLLDQRSTDWKDRAHFFALASMVIRRILVDHARERAAEKRGGGRKRTPFDRIELANDPRSLDLVALDEALEELASIDERQARIVELRFFGGLTIEEVAEILSIGKRSVDREWQCARAWLFARLSDPEIGVSDG
jgi:RNA polymerase sigma factor (TIGR02999 family)